MVVDYRALNKKTINNCYPVPCIDDVFDRLADSTIFLYLNLAQYYHWIRIFEEDAPKTAFRTPFGHYQFKILSFGLTNAPTTFQGEMNHVFHKFIGNFVLVYLHDILIFSKNKEEHVSFMQKCLSVISKRVNCIILDMLWARRALRWILRKLRMWPSGIDLLKSDNYGPSWGFAILFADLYIDTLLWLHLWLLLRKAKLRTFGLTNVSTFLRMLNMP